MVEQKFSAAQRVYRLSVSASAGDMRLGMYQSMVLSSLREADDRLDVEGIKRKAMELYSLDSVPESHLRHATDALLDSGHVERNGGSIQLTYKGKNEVQDRENKIDRLRRRLEKLLEEEYNAVSKVPFPEDQSQELSGVVEEFLVRVGEMFGGEVLQHIENEAESPRELDLDEVIEEGLDKVQREILVEADIDEGALKSALSNLISKGAEPLKEAVSQTASVFAAVEVIGADPELSDWSRGFIADCEVFLDTNVVFQILCSESGSHLESVLKELRHQGVTFYILDITEEEFQVALDHADYLYSKSGSGRADKEGFKNQIMRKFFNDKKSDLIWAEYIDWLQSGFEDLKDGLDLKATPVADWGFEEDAFLSSETDYVAGHVPSTRHRDMVEHDTVVLSLVHSLKEKEATSLAGPWFLSCDRNLGDADKALSNRLGAPGRSVVISPESLIEITRPHLPAEAQDHMGEVMLGALQTKVLPEPDPWDVESFLHFLIPDDIDETAIRRLLAEVSIDDDLRASLQTGDYDQAVRELLRAVKSEKFQLVAERLEGVIKEERELATRDLLEKAPDIFELVESGSSGPQARIRSIHATFQEADSLDGKVESLRELRDLLRKHRERMPGSGFLLEELERGIP